MFENKKTYDGKPFSHHTHDHDGIPKYGRMGAYIRTALGDTHSAYMEALNDPKSNRFPDPEHYKKVMRAARKKAIDEWSRIAPPGHDCRKRNGTARGPIP